MMKNCFIPNKRNRYKPYLLRKIAILVYSFVLVAVNSFGGLLGIEHAEASSITPANIIALTNQERSSMGLNTLNTNSKLSAAARAKANDMFEKQYWDHFGPNGETPWQFIRAAGYNYVYAGENLAKGFKTAEGVHEAWMASPTHKANLVSVNYKDIGVAVVEGVLLGKQTILVVQMFGNLTSEVYSSGGVVKSIEPKDSTTTKTSTQKVTTVKESGDIKSISITSPRSDSIVTNPSVPVKGAVANISGEYTVDIVEGGQIVGSTTSDKSQWEVKKESEWSEGGHKIKASVKGLGVTSKEVSFVLDSKSPTVIKDTLDVSKEDSTYKVSFVVDGEWETVSLVLGNQIKEANYSFDEEKNLLTLSVDESDVKGVVSLVLADKSGNTSQLDISEYFVENSSESDERLFPVITLNLGDKISIGIVSVVFFLLCIEIFIYWKNGRLKDSLGDVFTVGLWWFVLTIAIFNGFGGSLS